MGVRFPDLQGTGRRNVLSHSITSNAYARRRSLPLSLLVLYIARIFHMTRQGESPQTHFARIILCKYQLISAFTRRATMSLMVSGENGGTSEERKEWTDGKRGPKKTRGTAPEYSPRRKYPLSTMATRIWESAYWYETQNVEDKKWIPQSFANAKNRWKILESKDRIVPRFRYYFVPANKVKVAIG